MIATLLKGNLNKFLRALALLLVLFFYGCKKENWSDNDQASDPIIMEAKEWYEHTFPKISNGNHTNLSSGQQTFDPSQILQADWEHGETYIKSDERVVEVPLNAASKYFSGLRDAFSNRIKYNSTYSKTSFLFIKGAKAYDAYLMTIIADSSYIKNDLSKLNKNKYNKRDSDFSGVALYFTPKGEFISGWFYRNGILTNSFSSESKVSTEVFNYQKAKHTAGYSTNSIVNNCTDWYQYASMNGQIIDGSQKYLGRTCETVYVNDFDGASSGGGSGSGSGSGTGGGSGSGSSPQPPASPCSVVAPKGTLDKKEAGITNPGGGRDPGGFPNPTTTVKLPCPTSPETIYLPVQDIKTDSLKKHFPCATALIINPLLSIPEYNSLVTPFLVPNMKPSITWQDANLTWNAYDPLTGVRNSYMLGNTATDPSSGTGRSFVININTNALKNSSKLLLAAIAIHETLHAFIRYNVATAESNVANQLNDYGTWFGALDAYYIVRNLPTNYADHHQMLSANFDQTLSILATWDNNQHTQKEYAMAMLYGLNVVDPNTPADIKARINMVYNEQLTKYGITSEDLVLFNQNNINAPLPADRLPNNGCI